MGAYGTSQGGGGLGARPLQSRGGLGGYPHLGNLPLGALVCNGAANYAGAIADLVYLPTIGTRVKRLVCQRNG